MMDSGSSGSMQSSSGGGGVGGGGGDEEHDSRGESISSFLNHTSSGHFGGGSISNHPPPLSLLSHQQQQQQNSHHHQPTTTFFSQNLDVFQQSLATQNVNVNAQYNNDMLWPRGLRSEANYGTNFATLKASSSGIISHAPIAASSSNSLLEGNATTSSQQFDHQQHQQQTPPPPNVAAKNPKKRTRASRRAPTTVLTTDTTNFRQMVQEFTGIPTAPFSAGSPYSRRLDLFSTAGSAMRAGQLDTLGSLYPLRPSPQKLQLSSSIASSSSPSLFNSSVINAAGTSNTLSSNTNSFQVPSSLGLQKPTQNILNMQNQLLTFEPLLQPHLPSSLKLPIGNESFLSNRGQGSANMPSLDDQIGMGHQQQVNANLGGFSNQASSEATRQARNNDDSVARWRDGGTLNINGGHENLGSFDGNDHGSTAQHIGSFKFNSSSSSDFNPEKVLENTSSGGVEFTNYN